MKKYFSKSVLVPRRENYSFLKKLKNEFTAPLSPFSPVSSTSSAQIVSKSATLGERACGSNTHHPTRYAVKIVHGLAGIHERERTNMFCSTAVQVYILPVFCSS